MPSITSIRWNLAGWRQAEEKENCVTWHNDSNDLLSVNFFALPPDIPVALTALNELREFFRASVAAEGGVISIDVLSLRGIPAVKTIFKFPQQPHGMTYLACLIFPFRDFSYVVKTQCVEYGITGARDSFVFSQFFLEGPTLDPEGGFFRGWSQYPYDPNCRDPNLRNMSEDEKYDERFPEHPLTRARKYLAIIAESVSFDDDLICSAPFRPGGADIIP